MKYAKTEFRRENRNDTAKPKEKAGAEPFAYEDLKRKGGVAITHTIPSTAAATAGNYGVFFIAPRAMTIMWVAESHQVASTSGTLNLEILSSGVAPGSGDSVLGTAFDLSATADTPQTAEGTDLTSTRVLSPGDRLALVDGGTLTNQDTVTVTVYLIYANRGDFF